MRRLLLTVAIAIGAAAVAAFVLRPDAPTSERLSAAESLDGIDVPRVGTVGDFPEPARRIVVNLTRDGTIVVDGRRLEWHELVALLERRAASTPGEILPGQEPQQAISDTAAVLRADGDLPWGAALDVYVTCMSSRIRSTSFAVRHEDDGVEGALAVFGSTLGDQDDELNSAGLLEDARRTVVASADEGAGRDSPEALYATLAASRGTLSGLSLVLTVDPRLPTRTALGLLDASLRAGARWGRFARPGIDPPRDARVAALGGYSSEVARPRQVAPAYSVHVADFHGRPLDLLTPIAMPHVALQRGRAAGITWGHDHSGTR